MKGKCTLDQIYIKTHYNNTLKMESYFSWITSCISICRNVTIYDIECLLNILFENCIGVDNTLLDMFKKWTREFYFKILHSIEITEIRLNEYWSKS